MRLSSNKAKNNVNLKQNQGLPTFITVFGFFASSFLITFSLALVVFDQAMVGKFCYPLYPSFVSYFIQNCYRYC